ncbi:MAG: HTTM domain-containing protein [Pirellulales bacterium]
MDTPQPARGILPALRDLGSRAFTLDVRSLAAFRVAIGLILVADCLLRTRDFGLMFTPDGIFPPDLLRQFHGDPFLWSLALLDDSAWWGGCVLAAEGVAGGCLAVGVGTRLATAVAWVALVSVIRRTSPATNAGDAWLACLVFWSMFLPLGAVWSVDAWRRGRASLAAAPPTVVRSVASAALVLEVVAVYLGAGLSKCNATWFSGAAMAHALSVHDHGTWLGEALARADWLARPLTWSVVFAELGAPILLVLRPTPRVRMLTALAFMAFHLAIWVTMSVGLFAAIGIAAWLPLLPAQFWDRATGVVAVPPRVASLRGPAAWACATALAIALASFLQIFGPWRSTRPPRPLMIAAHALCLVQEWAMFGAVPPQEQWVYGRAELIDGSVVDLLRNGRPFQRDRPAGGFSSLAHHRWHKFFWVLPRAHVRIFGPAAAAALARDWNARHGAAHQVRRLEIRFGVQGVAAPDTPLQEMLVASWPTSGPDGQGNLDRLLDTVAGPSRDADRSAGAAR